MSDENDILSRRRALLRVGGLALGAYAAPSLTALSMAHASGGSGGSGGGNGGGSGNDDASIPSEPSEPSEPSTPETDDASEASLPSGIDSPQECSAAGGTWDPGDSNCI